MHCNQIAIAPHTPCNCAAMHLNQTCASRNIWSAVCNKTTLPKKIQWARRNTRSVKNKNSHFGERTPSDKDAKAENGAQDSTQTSQNACVTSRTMVVVVVVGAASDY